MTWHAQTEALAAVTAAQHLPPLQPFTAEGKLAEKDNAEWWLEQFEEEQSYVVG